MNLLSPLIEDPAERQRRELEALLGGAPQLSMEPEQPSMLGSDDLPSPGGGALGDPSVMEMAKQMIESSQGQAPAASPPRGMGTSQVTQRTQLGGLSPEDKALDVAAQGDFQLGEAQIQRERLEAQAQEFERQAAALRAQAQVENEQRQQAEAENAAKQERLRGQQQELAEQDAEPIDPDRYYKNRSVFQDLAAVVSAGIHGYLGGPGAPPIIGLMQQRAQQDVQAQLSNAAQQRDKRDTLIQQYERQYGDTTLVAKRLEADKLLTLAKETQAQGATAKTNEAKAAAQDLEKQLKNRVGLLHREIQSAMAQKPIVDQTTTYQPLKKAGAGEAMKNQDKAFEMAKKAREQGWSDQQIRDKIFRPLGVEAPKENAAVDVARDDSNKKDLDTRRQKYAVENVELADEETAMQATAKALGGTYDKDSGELRLPKDLTGFGVGTALRNVPGTSQKAAHDALLNLTDVKQRQRSGAGASASETQKLERIVSGSNLYGLDEDAVKNALQTVAASLRSRRRASDAGAGEDVLRSFQEEQDKLKKGLQITPLTGRITR